MWFVIYFGCCWFDMLCSTLLLRGDFGVTTPTTRIIVITSILLALCYIFKIWQVNALKSVLGAYVPLLKYKAIAYFLLPWKSAYESNVENNTAATLDSNIFINFYSTLKDNYGRRWRAKTRILLVMGDAPQVDQLVPELTSQRWVEGDGVVLIWEASSLQRLMSRCLIRYANCIGARWMGLYG